MELDEFKSLLQSGPADPPAMATMPDMEKIRRSRAGSVTGQLKQSIRLEFALCCLLAAACAWMGWHWPYLYVQSIAVLAAGYCVVFLYFLRRLYKKIIYYEHAAPAVREGLEQTIGILERFGRLYFQFNMFMLPVAFVLGLITGYLDISVQAAGIGFSFTKAASVYIAFFLSWSVFMYFFSKWYIKKQYGNHLKQLKEQLEDIKNG